MYILSLSSFRTYVIFLFVVPTVYLPLNPQIAFPKESLLYDTFPSDIILPHEERGC